MAQDRDLPNEDPYANRFDLPVRAVYAALEAVRVLGPHSTSDEIFRAMGRLSAATGFLARELHNADEVARHAQGLPNRPVIDPQRRRTDIQRGRI